MSDIHLDTSWCPVCDCAILPRRYSVPVSPLPQQQLQQLPSTSTSNAVRSSQTTRGKNGTIKARHTGGGLAQGTGRIRPGLHRAHTTYANAKGKSPLRLADQQQVLFAPIIPAEPVKMKTIIDQSQTPLYCSDECRKRDLEDSWLADPLPTRKQLELDEKTRRSAAVAAMAATAATNNSSSSQNVRLGAHPSQINPARASPPPPSPTLPPVPPNSFKAPRAVRSASGDGDDSTLDLSALKLRPYEDPHSDSSSATGSSFTTSDRSPVDERRDSELFGNPHSTLFTDPAPPPLPEMPLHPHRPSAPVTERSSRPEKRWSDEWQGGFMMAARRLSTMFSINAAQYETEASRREKAEAERRTQKERELRRKWFGDKVADAEEKKEDAERKQREEDAREDREKAKKWAQNIYNPWNGAPSTATSSAGEPGIPSTHRRGSENATTIRAPRANPVSRTQSALELYAKYPIFAGSSSRQKTTTTTTTTTSAGPGLKNPCKSSASLATSSSNAYAVPVAVSSSGRSSSHSHSHSHSHSKHTTGASTDASTLPGIFDAEAYRGKRIAGTRPKRQIAEGLEKQLCLPDVLLRPIPPTVTVPRTGSGSGLGSGLGAQLASSLPNSGLAGEKASAAAGEKTGTAMRRSESEVNVLALAGRARGKAKRSTSALGSVREEAAQQQEVQQQGEQGNWHTQEPSDAASSVSGSTSSANGTGLPRLGRRRGSASRYNWTYDNVEGPKYEAAPRRPKWMRRVEDVFLPLEGLAVGEKQHIEVSTLHTGDEELERRVVREVKRRPGRWEGREGWWVETEFEIFAVEERKRLFVFGGEGRAGRR